LSAVKKVVPLQEGIERGGNGRTWKGNHLQVVNATAVGGSGLGSLTERKAGRFGRDK